MTSIADIVIRPETSSEVLAIHDINVAAFLKHPFSHQTEHLIVDALRTSGALEVSLVALRACVPVGHIAFSKAGVGTGEGWYLLGPVAVLPAAQGMGIGSALVIAGLDELRRLNARGCVLVGEPGFYGRFGFTSVPGLTYSGVPDAYVLGLAFSDELPSGEIHAHAAFSID